MCSYDLYGFTTTKCDTTNTKWIIEQFTERKRIYYCAKVVTNDEYAYAICSSLMKYFKTYADAIKFVNETKSEEYKPNG